MVQDALRPHLRHAQHIAEIFLNAQDLMKTQINNVQKQQTSVKQNYVLIQ